MAANFLLCGRCISSDPPNPPVAAEEIVPESDTDATMEEWTSVERVFANELLLDKILKFSLYNTGDKLDIRTARTCRMVNSTWLLRVNVAIERAHLPPVKLHTCRNPNKITRFVQAFQGCSAYQIFSFHLTISPTKDGRTSWTDEYTALILHTAMKSLWRCGNGLVELTINCENAFWDVTGDPLVFSPVPLNLPHLQKITIQVERRKRRHRHNLWWLQNTLAVKANVKVLPQQNRQDEEAPPRTAVKNLELNLSHGKMQALVQRILAGSFNVKSLSIFSYTFAHPDQHSWGINLKYLELPESLQAIHFTTYSPIWAVPVDDLLLTHSHLPNLTSLSLQIDAVEKCNLKNKVERVLSMLRHQLVKLDISNAEKYTGDQISLQLPVMESLQELWCGLWIGEEPKAVGLDTHFPVLKKFTCFETSPTTLLLWIEESESVSFSVVDVHLQFSENHGVGDSYQMSRLFWRKIRGLKMGLPNLTQLVVVFNDFDQQTYAMKCIFQYLTQLRILEVDVKYGDISSDAFNGLLLGICAEKVRTLRETLTGVSVNYEVGSSIVNLQELKKLHLSIPKVDDDLPKCGLDITVKYGVTRMPNLADFSYSGGLSLLTPHEISHWLKSNQRVYRR